MNWELLKEGALEILFAFIGAFGFSLLFSLRGKRLFWAAFGGAVAWAFYFIVEILTSNMFLCGIVSAMVATAYSEIFARILKTPKTAFIFTAIVPMVPGGSLYYAMSNMITSNIDMALKYATDTIVMAVALALGIVVVILWVKVTKHIKAKKNIRV